jgi:fructose-1,6-bisphosphatase-3
MGACLGHEALIATVVRLSLRYRRLSQIEEGFGITMAPVEKLTRDVYGTDPATHFQSRGTGLREAIMMARMQKAMAVMQFKLEA